jgi:hypothetical protein
MMCKSEIPGGFAIKHDYQFENVAAVLAEKHEVYS